MNDLVAYPVEHGMYLVPVLFVETMLRHRPSSKIYLTLSIFERPFRTQEEHSTFPALELACQLYIALLGVLSNKHLEKCQKTRVYHVAEPD